MGFLERLGLRRCDATDERKRPLAQPRELLSREGQDAIYTENGIASHVRIEGVIFEGPGVRVELAIVPRPGLVTGQETGFVASKFSVGSHWSSLWVSRQRWQVSTQGCNWGLFFDPQLIEEIDRLGASLDGQKDRHHRLRALRERLSQAVAEECRNSVNPVNQVNQGTDGTDPNSN